ncbi:MAG: cytochrome b/b6 domain-containing protein [Pseudomonadota bacterium]
MHLDIRDAGAARPRNTVLVRRHGLVTRVTHWINAACFGLLLLSGLQIFNAWPRLYWGHHGADEDSALLSIGAAYEGGQPRGFVRAGTVMVPTTGVLGVSTVDGAPAERAFPGWLTLPSYQDLAAGRRWHFFFAWCLVANGALYLAWSLASGHLRRDLLPARAQLAPRHLWRETVDHARLRFPTGDAARRYNALQKISYLLVVAVLLPAMLLSGLTMSPGLNAAFPALLDLFGGRQSARTVHFMSAAVLVLFVLVHLAMVLLSGPWNNLRSMITGRYAIEEAGAQHD